MMVNQLALSSAIVLVFTILAPCATSMGFAPAPNIRDLHLASALGMDADTVLLNHAQFRQHIDNARGEEVPTEWATVCFFLSKCAIAYAVLLTGETDRSQSTTTIIPSAPMTTATGCLPNFINLAVRFLSTTLANPPLTMQRRAFSRTLP
jgi:hypothetical protein